MFCKTDFHLGSKKGKKSSHGLLAWPGKKGMDGWMAGRPATVQRLIEKKKTPSQHHNDQAVLFLFLQSLLDFGGALAYDRYKDTHDSEI